MAALAALAIVAVTGATPTAAVAAADPRSIAAPAASPAFAASAARAVPAAPAMPAMPAMPAAPAVPGEPGIPGAQSPPGVAAASATDTIRARQWPLTALHVSRAWKYARGEGVTVAVLDTGVDGRHQDLAGQVINGPDYTDGLRKPGTKYWGRHGTAVASIIAGHGHGPGLASGIMGIAPKAKILSIRVTWENDDPARAGRADLNRNSDAVSRGIRYAVDHGADIINMSLGGGRLDYFGNETDEQAVNYALSKGVVLIASMGNDGSTQNRRNFPAAYPGVIAVGATDRSFRPWKDSNRHEYVSVAAPGVDVVSADAGNGYVIGSGTSTSAAFVAGVASLVKAEFPKLTPKEVKQALEEGVSRRPQAGRDTRVGAGAVDAIGALKAGYKINKLVHGGTAAPKPAPAAAGTPAAVPEAHSTEPNILLIGILGGGGLLVLVGLVMGWRQRRRPDDDDQEPFTAAPDEDRPGASQAEPLVPSSPERAAAVPAGLRSTSASAAANGHRNGHRATHAQDDPYGLYGPSLEPGPPVSGRSGHDLGGHGLILTGHGFADGGTNEEPARVADDQDSDPLVTDPLNRDPLDPDRLNRTSNPDPLVTDPLGSFPSRRPGARAPLTDETRRQRPLRGYDVLDPLTPPEGTRPRLIGAGGRDTSQAPNGHGLPEAPAAPAAPPGPAAPAPATPAASGARGSARGPQIPADPTDPLDPPGSQRPVRDEADQAPRGRRRRAPDTGPADGPVGGPAAGPARQAPGPGPARQAPGSAGAARPAAGPPPEAMTAPVPVVRPEAMTAPVPIVSPALRSGATVPDPLGPVPAPAPGRGPVSGSVSGSGSEVDPDERPTTAFRLVDPSRDAVPPPAPPVRNTGTGRGDDTDDEDYRPPWW